MEQKKRALYIQFLAFAIVLSLLGSNPASGSEQRTSNYPVFSDNFRPELPSDAEQSGFVSINRDDTATSTSRVNFKGPLFNPVNQNSPDGITLSSTRLIVKVSSSLGETSTVVSETSTANSVIEKSRLAQIQLDSKTNLLASKYGAIKKVSISNLSNKGISSLSKKGFVYERWDFASEKELLSASKLIEKEKGIVSIRRDFAMQISATPNDPGYSQLWGMQSLRAPAAWNTTRGSRSVVVAVIDTGIDLDHPDLVNNLWRNPGEIAGDGIDNDNNGYEDDIHGWDFVSGDATPNDDIGTGAGSPGHGTHVAGTIAAEGNNSVGVVGVNWQASLMALRICGPSGCYLSDFWAALNYAYNNGAQVANASFGGQYNPFQEEEDYISGVAEPGDYPLQKGVLVVAAAGNNGSNNDVMNFCPACYQLPNLVSVAATTSSNDSLASFSNYGSQKVTIAAPGQDIYSTIPPGAFGYTGLYGSISGTSMAAPHVAGVAALFQSANGSWKPSAIKKALIKSARKTTSMSGRVLSNGVANAQEILNINTEPQPFLSIDFKGTGSGKIQIGSQECTSDCILEIAAGTSMLLIATSTGNSTFVSWGGVCLGTDGNSCSWTHMLGGTFVSVTLNGPPLVTHEQSELLSSESIEVWNDNTYRNYFGNYVSTSLSSDAKSRARAVFRFPTGGWCSYVGVDTGGVSVREEELDVEEATWTAPYIGSDEPYGRWSNCGSFGKDLQLSDNGNYLITTTDPYSWINNWNDPSQDFFTCGTLLYKRDGSGTWSNGVAIGPSDRRDCFTDTTRTSTGWSGYWNWMGAILTPDNSKMFVKGSKRIFVINLSDDTVASRETITLPTNCRAYYNLSTNSTGTKLLVPTSGCDLATNALLYTKGLTGWVLTKRFSDASSDGSGTIATVLSRDATTLALSYVNGSGSGVSVYELQASVWNKVKNLNTVSDFYNFTNCKFISTNNARIICSSSNVDVGNNPQQGLVIVYDRNGSTWANTPFRSILWDTNGIPLEQMRFQSASADGTTIDAAIGGSAIGAAGLSTTFMGITFKLNFEGPSNLTRPEISGALKVGSTLTATDGTWSGTPTPSIEFAWHSCNSETDLPTTSCTPISGATSRTLLLNSSLINRYIRVAVTATNNGGTEVIFSDAEGVVGIAPSVVGTDKISGTPVVGNVLSVSIPQWSGTPSPTYYYDWYRCESESTTIKNQLPANCQIISNTNSRTYTLTSDDYLKYVLLEISGTNIHGAIDLWTATTKQILSGPTNSAAPTVTGTAAVGQTLSATAGTWSGSPTPKLTYQWLSCTNDSSTDSCTAITGATRNTFKLVTAQAATYIRVRVTATNSITATAAFSTATAAIGSPPIASGTLTQSGTASVGSTLTLTDGLTWVGSPTPSVSTQWYRCSAKISRQAITVPGTCSAISGATSGTYLLTSDDSGKFVAPSRVATSSAGTITLLAISTATAIGQAPTNSAAPTVTGTAAVGQTLSATAGTWSGSPTPKLTYQWLSCTNDSSTDSCTAITGATRNTFKLVTAQAATYIRVRVTATNSITATAAFSTATAAIGSPPIASGTLTQSGTASVGSTLTLTDGLTWVGYPTPSVSTQWYRCSAKISRQAITVPGTCSAISGATSGTYLLTSDDSGKFVAPSRVATSSAGTITLLAISTATAIGQAPTNSAAPTVTGTAAVGQTLSATAGTWSGSPTPKLTYQWLSCTNDSSTDSCTAITGATRNTFKLVTAQAATYIRVRVTATNSITATAAFSTATARLPG